MVLANLYLLLWDYDKLKYILPFKHTVITADPQPYVLSNKFPKVFFAGAAATVVVVVLVLTNVYDIMPRNTIRDCDTQCKDSKNPKAYMDFCDCIHTKGQPLDQCLHEYHKALKGTAQKN
jgi:hypothetical protein